MSRPAININDDKKYIKGFAEIVQNFRNFYQEKIAQAKPVQYALDLPIVLPSANEESALHVLVADAGKGKSIFSLCLASSILSRYDDTVVVYYDLEFSEVVAKERQVHVLLEKFENRFFYFGLDFVDAIKQFLDAQQDSLAIIYATHYFRQLFPEQRLVVFVDSFEDFIGNSSNDEELKGILRAMLSTTKGVCWVLNHHIGKDLSKDPTMSFRGSMVIKAKVTSMLLLTARTKETDFQELFELVPLKIRTAYPPAQKLLVRLSLQNWCIQNVDITSDSEEVFILKNVFFVLKKVKEMKKTELVRTVSEKTQKHHEKVAKTLEKHKEYFDIRRGEKNAQIFRLPTGDRLERFLALIGMPLAFSEEKFELQQMVQELRQCNLFPPDMEISCGNRIFVGLDGVLSSLTDISDQEARDLKKVLLQLSDRIVEEKAPF